MNYRAFTNDSLTMIYEAVRGALAADDALKRQESETKFRVRETPDWRHHAADLEAEMLKRGMMFEVIDWSEDQATLPGLYPATSKQRWRTLGRPGLPGPMWAPNPQPTR